MKRLLTLLGLTLACFAAHATSVIHILFVYTPSASTFLGGAQIISSAANNAVTSMNQAFANSGLGSAAAATSAGIYSTSSEYPLNTASTAQASLAAAEANLAIGVERDYSGADVVVIIGPPAGAGPVICGASDGFLPGAQRAYALVAADCLVTDVTLQHEVGHLMGLHHDYASDPSCTPGYSNCHGYRFEFGDGTTSDYCANTIMAVIVNASCDETGPNRRINYYGNPSISISNGKVSVPTGNTAAPYFADEADTLFWTTRIPPASEYLSSP